MNPARATSQLPGCGVCSDTVPLFPFTMAFQPIVDAAERRVYAYEALVRGNNGESALSVMSQVTEANRFAFDQQCRTKAVMLAASLGMHREGARLSVNWMADAVYSPSACIQRTLQTAGRTGFPLHLLTFEVTEDKRIPDLGHMEAILGEGKAHGFHIALDDFGAGFSGLSLLSDLKVNTVKLDIGLVQGLDRKPRTQEIVRSVADLCSRIGVEVIAEGVETLEEYRFLLQSGIRYMQGFLFARPLVETLPQVLWPQWKPPVSMGRIAATPHSQAGASHPLRH